MNITRYRAAAAAAKRHYIDGVRRANPELANQLDNLVIKWYDLRNVETDDDTTEVFIYEEISSWWGISSAQFISDLNKVKTKNITLRLNSPGGNVFEGIAIYNALVQHPANIKVHVDSLAASAASVIAMAGDSIVMMVGSQLMIHDASGVEVGDARMMREMADFLDKQSDNISTIYAARTGGDPKDYRAMMLKETWMFAAEAVELGLADGVYTKPEKKSEEDDTESETEKSEEESTEDGAEEESDSDMSEEDLDNLMKKWHDTSNRGFKYQNRLAAPKPAVSTEDEINRILAAWK